MSISLLRNDLTTIADLIPQNASVLDLACGDGDLLKYLQEDRGVTGYGLENSPEQIQACIKNGVNVVEKTLDRTLSEFADRSFDVVVMTQALQVMSHPDVILEEMLRVGRSCVVTFPNFGNWRARLYLALAGKMPVTKKLPYQWYDTPNIHFCTVNDFESLCISKGYRILERTMLADQTINRQFKNIAPNLFSETAVYQLSAD